jgi:hypothetical protein
VRGFACFPAGLAVCLPSATHLSHLPPSPPIPQRLRIASHVSLHSTDSSSGNADPGTDALPFRASQTERIALIKVALMNKIGEGGMRHYGLDSSLDEGKPAVGPGTAAPADSTNPADAAHPDVTPQSAGGAAPTSRAQAGANEAREPDEADGLYL